RPVREALASLHELAADRVLNGGDKPGRDVAALTMETLARSGLDRAAAIAAAMCPLAEEQAPQRARGLLRALLLARLAGRFPDGPAPRAAIEPLVRSRRPEHEQVL